MKYLFVDIEWKQENGLTRIDITELSAIFFDDNTNEKIFFEKKMFLKASNFIARIINLRYRLNKKRRIKKIMKSFIEVFSQYDLLIIWNKQNYKILKQFLNLYNLTLPNHRNVFLQKIINEIYHSTSDKEIGFKKALKDYEIEHETEKLHQSEYDVKYLMELYLTLREKKRSEIGEKNLSLCSRKELKKVLSLAQLEGISSIQGYLQECRHRAKKEKQKISQERRIIDDDYIEEICKLHKLEYEIKEGMVWVKTNVAGWRIYHNRVDVTSLYHQNSGIRKKSDLPINDYNYGYHNQKIKEKNFNAVVKYIVKHDRNVRKRRKRKKEVGVRIPFIRKTTNSLFL